MKFSCPLDLDMVSIFYIYRQRDTYSRRVKYIHGTYVTNFSRQITNFVEIIFFGLNPRQFKILNKKKVRKIIFNSGGKYCNKNFCQPPISSGHTGTVL
jgi:hypothetical protein